MPSRTDVRLRFLTLLGGIPMDANIIGRFSLLVSEDMRMPSNHLVGDLFNHGDNVEAAFISGDLRIEHDLQQYIPKFFLDCCVVIAVDRFEEFVGLFECVGFNRCQRLDTIPGATFR